MRRLVLLAALAACRLDDRPVVLVGDAPGSGAPDGGTPEVDGGPCYPRATTIAPAHTHGGQGTYAKQRCMEGGCHGPGSTTPFVAAGTILTPTLAGAAGAHFLFLPANLMFEVDVATDTAGNFYITGTADEAFPATVGISLCPTTKSMLAQISSKEGDCNACHDGSVDDELIVGD